MAYYNNFDDNYAGIIAAFQKVREDAGESQKFYQPNYQGIIEAILDMNKSWSGTTPGEYPPGWVPIYDEDGNIIGGNWEPGYEPAQGTLWFDERQGRLMVYLDDAYYQANGADVLTKVQPTQPEPDVPGALWYNPDTNDLYIYDGLIWVLISSTSVSTSNLPVGNPTGSGSGDTRVLPDSNGLVTQADYNEWVFGALSALDENLGGNADVYVSDTAPAPAEEGDLWYSTASLELLVRHDESWIPASVPLVSDPNFVSLATLVDSNMESVTSLIETTNNRITSLETSVENKPHKSYNLEVDHAVKGIKLVDELGNSSRVPFIGEGGISVSPVNDVIKVDGSALETALLNVISTYTTEQQRSDLVAADQSQAARIAALEAVSHVTVNDFDTLSNTVDSLPRQSDVATRLAIAGGELTGSLEMNSNRISGLGSALLPGDAVRNGDFQDYKNQVAETYAPLSNPVFNGLVVERDDISIPGIKITDGAAAGRCAIELNTDRVLGTTAKFGQTQYPGEVAWEFGGNENFGWIHDATGKQLRIDKDEVVIKKLSLGTFSKDVNGDDVITNKIDVKERLNSYQTALQDVRTALSNATSFDEFKTAAFNALIGI